MERTIRAIDRAFESLDDVDAELLKERYINGRSWAETAELLNYTEKWAREKGGRALRDMALMLFGIHMQPMQLKLIHIPVDKLN